jgi:hypothetical protein
MLYSPYEISLWMWIFLYSTRKSLLLHRLGENWKALLKIPLQGGKGYFQFEQHIKGLSWYIRRMLRQSFGHSQRLVQRETWRSQWRLALAQENGRNDEKDQFNTNFPIIRVAILHYFSDK